ncbi:Protocadherin gamma-A4 [Varanus komodoensis]|nr:Protocadherin gamma-A4 [Varanus komodoensis]
MARAKGRQETKGKITMKTCRRGVACFFLLVNICQAAAKQVHYSIPEETERGFFVGNIARDLGLDAKELSGRGIRIVSPGRTPYFALNYRNGHLHTTERIDREQICGQMQKCVLEFEVIIGASMKIYGVGVEITDINDHAPTFQSEKLVLNVSENTAVGSQFPLLEAQDPDLGNNSLQGYKLSSSSYFSLVLKTSVKGKQFAKLVLERPLDHEEEKVHHLILTAYDGGSPVRSGTTEIQISVLDVNDNAPIFSQPLYEVTAREGLSLGTTVVTLNATDLDEGTNRDLRYSFAKSTGSAAEKFHLDENTGEVTLRGSLDYEDSTHYEIQVQVQDGGGLSDRSTLTVFVTDVNDNAPKLEITSLIGSIPENSPPATAIALVHVQDRDSAENAEVTCSIPSHLPFQLAKSYNNYYNLLTTRVLDREQVATYNVTVTATDHGTPPLSTSLSIPLEILDTNDNPPHFLQSVYVSYLMENNPRGASILSLEAEDPDWAENSRITFSILEGKLNASPVSSHLSINSETGVVYALHSFDYEELYSTFTFQKEARPFLEKDALRQSLVVLLKDNGQPPLSASVTVTVVLADSIPEVLSDLGGISAPADAQPDLTFYLVLAVAFVSCLFFAFLLVLLALNVHKWRHSRLQDCGNMTSNGVPAPPFVGLDTVRAVLHSYCHEVCLTADSRHSHFHLPKGCSCSTFSSQKPHGRRDPFLAAEGATCRNGNPSGIQVISSSSTQEVCVSRWMFLP